MPSGSAPRHATLTLPEASEVRAEAYDALGRRVAMLVEGPLGVGRHALTLDAAGVAPRVYVVCAVVTAGAVPSCVLTQRLTVAR